jgi:pimeloyl-[acyl-carrier protein] methyl ester esterase
MKLSVDMRGSGRDLVLLHGWGAGARVWDGLIPELERTCRLHLVDMPGYGASEPCAPYTLDALAAAVADACPPPVAVCGWSLGAQVALQWALARPAQVSRLVLIAATPRFVAGGDWPHGVAAETFAAFERGLIEDAAATLARFIALEALDDTARAAVTRALRSAAEAAPSAVALAGGLDVLRTTDLRARLAEVKQPVLLLHGARDRVTPPAASAALAALLPHAQRTVIADAGHAPFLAREAAMARAIADFLRDE